MAIPTPLTSAHEVIVMGGKGSAQPCYPGGVLAVASVDPIFLSRLRTLHHYLLSWLFRKLFRRSVSRLRRLHRRLLRKLAGKPVRRLFSDLQCSRGRRLHQKTLRRLLWPRRGLASSAFHNPAEARGEKLTLWIIVAGRRRQTVVTRIAVR